MLIQKHLKFAICIYKIKKALQMQSFPLYYFWNFLKVKSHIYA